MEISLTLLKVNKEKTGAFTSFMPKVMETLGPPAIFAKSSIGNLGVCFNSAFTLDAAIKFLLCSCFCH